MSTRKHSSPSSIARFGWLVWGGFAIAICALVLLKADTFVLLSDEQLAGRVQSRDAQSITIRQIDGGDTSLRTIPTSEIVQHNRFGHRSVSGVYARASRQWWASESMYGKGSADAGTVHGYLYFPQSAIAYSPFAYVPSGLGEIAWRLVGIAGYAWGVWGLTRRLFLRDAGLAFLVASIFAIPAAMGSASNGQTNVLMGGAIALTAVAIMDRRWWWATAWMVLLVICKPTALAVVGLVGVTFWRALSWRLLIAGVCVGVLGLAHPSLSFSIGQSREFVEKMLSAAAPADLYQDIRGLLAAWGITSAENQLSVLRAIAGVAMLGLAIWAHRRMTPLASAMSVLTLGAIYITLFNPRTEGLSYAIIGPVLAAWATRELWERRWPSAVSLIVLCMLLQFSRQVTLGEHNTWVRPLGVLAWLGFVGWEVVRGSRWPIGRIAAWIGGDAEPSRDSARSAEVPKSQHLH